MDFAEVIGPLQVSVDPLHGELVVSRYGTPHQRLQAVAIPDGLERLDDQVKRCVGFRHRSYGQFPIAGADPQVWDDGRYLAPILDQRCRSIGEIVLLARARFGRSGTPDVTLALEARAVSAQGDWPTALELWRQSLAAGNLDAHHAIGTILLSLGLPAQARDHLTASAEHSASSPERWILLGNACTQAGDDPAARRAYVTALRAGPGRPSHVNEIASRLAGLHGPRPLWNEDWWTHIPH